MTASGCQRLLAWQDGVVPKKLRLHFPGVAVYIASRSKFKCCINVFIWKRGQSFFFLRSLAANQQQTKPNLRERARARRLKPYFKLVPVSAQPRFRVFTGTKEVEIEKEEVLHFIFLEQTAPLHLSSFILLGSYTIYGLHFSKQYMQ